MSGRFGSMMTKLACAGAGLMLATAAYAVQANHAGHGAVAPATGKPATPPPGVPVPAHGTTSTTTTTPPAAVATPAGATTTAPAAQTAAVDPAAGRELFNNWGCSSCHSLADAGAAGHVGPELDGNPNLTAELVTSRITNGQGAMPAFGGQLSDAEIKTLSAYIMQVKK